MEVTSGQICEDLVALIGKTKVSMVALAEDMQLTPIQMFTLYAILNGEVTMGKVAGALHCDASNVTGIVDRLVAQDMVIRHECESDRRAKTLQLTKKGQKTIHSVLDKLPAYLGCDKLSQAERATLHVAIGKLTA
jgi:DNA-binding MarR family transcriptional regulator